MKVIGLLGNAGAGKDTVAEMITGRHPVHLDGVWVNVRELAPPPTPVEPLRERAAQIALADPLKEYARTVYDFSVTQLWGPSSARNAGDPRYPKTCSSCKGAGLCAHPYGQDDHVDLACIQCSGLSEEPWTARRGVKGTGVVHLSPREALQKLGTEWGRTCWDMTWLSFGLRRARTFLETTRAVPALGSSRASFVLERTSLVVVSDLRFVNEAREIRAAGGEVWSIVRPELDTSGAMYTHQSEREQKEKSFELRRLVSRTIMNDGTRDDLKSRVRAALAAADL